MPEVQRRARVPLNNPLRSGAGVQCATGGVDPEALIDDTIYIDLRRVAVRSSWRARLILCSYSVCVALFDSCVFVVRNCRR